MTVLGPVPVDQLGVTLPHEHLHIDLTAYVDELARFRRDPEIDNPVELGNLAAVRSNPYGNRDNCLLDDDELALAEVARFRQAGGHTIVDLTNPDIGRAPTNLQDISRASGINIVAGCGHYVNFAQPDYVAEQTMGQIADWITREIEEGIAGSGVRPGIIGEIGTTSPLHANEEKVLRAAARAHSRTGLTVSVHVHPPTRAGHDVLDILADEGMDLHRVVLCHLDAALAHLDIDLSEAIDYQASLAARGAFVEFDLCGNSGYFTDGRNSWWLPSDLDRCRAIARLIDAGHIGSLLISQDVGHKHYLSSYGGWGFAHVLTQFKDMLASVGVESDEHKRIVRDNPAVMLTGDVDARNLRG